MPLDNFNEQCKKKFKRNEHRILPPFFDDIIIKGNTFDQHLNNVDHILQNVGDANFTLDALKCSFFQRKIKYLGHVIDQGKIMLDPDRMQVISSIPVPPNVAELRRFIRMAQFCHRFSPNINVILSPLYELLKLNGSYHWSSDCLWK